MISFSSITDRPKGNLDDVTDWYITDTIIKDPPHGISTRRIVKVGQDNDLLEAGDRATDRNDAILQFARNVNPMVSVEYNNTGAAQAFLPHRIMKDGAFRPPIVYQRDLLPLSRLPRDTTSINTSAEWIDFSKWERPSDDATKYKQVLNTLQVTPLCATKTLDCRTGVDRPHEIKYHIGDKPQRIKQCKALNPIPENELFRGSWDGVIEGSSGRTPMPKSHLTWFSHTNKVSPFNQTVNTNSNGLPTDNLNREEFAMPRNLPAYSIDAAGRPVGQVAETTRTTTRGIKDPRETFSFANSGPRPVTVGMNFR